MRVTIVGSGTLLPNDRQRSPGHLVETGRAKVLFDCGSGILHGLERDGRAWELITHVAISHFHADHFGDLPALLWAWTHGVSTESPPPRTLIGPLGMQRVLAALSGAYGGFVLEPGGPLDLVELGPDDTWEDPENEFVLRTHKTRHTEESVAYLIQADEGVLGYTGDTGPHPPLGPFLRGADVLITECAVPDSAPFFGHLSPKGVAELAAQAQPKTLVLTHLYPTVEREGLEERVRALGFRGVVRVAEDGLVIDLPSADPEISLPAPRK